MTPVDFTPRDRCHGPCESKPLAKCMMASYLLLVSRGLRTLLYFRDPILTVSAVAAAHRFFPCTGGGCNTATRTCNPITNRANGVSCTGGTCQNGVCRTSSTACTNPPGQTQATCVCARSPLGYYQDTFNGCRGGIWCYSGGSQYVPCATGTLYDANLKVCNWASQVTCPAVRIASATAAAGSRTASRRARAGVTRNPAQTAEEAAAAAVAASAVAAALPAGPVDGTVVDATGVTAASATAGVVAPAAVVADGVPVAEPTAAAVAAPVGDVAAATGAAVVTEAGTVTVADPAAAAVAP